MMPPAIYSGNPIRKAKALPFLSIITRTRGNAKNIAQYMAQYSAQIESKLVEMNAADPSISSGFAVSTVNVDKVLLTIRLLMGVAVAVLISIAFIGSFRFKLNNTILERMRFFTEKVKTGEYETLSDAEKAERVDLIKKHYGRYDADKDAAVIARLTESTKVDR